MNGTRESAILKRHSSVIAREGNEVANLSKILNGPQGSVASKTAASIEILRLKAI